MSFVREENTQEESKQDQVIDAQQQRVVQQPNKDLNVESKEELNVKWKQIAFGGGVPKVFYNEQELKESLYPKIYELLKIKKNDEQLENKSVKDTIKEILKEIKSEIEKKDGNELLKVLYKTEILIESEYPKTYNHLKNLKKDNQQDNNFFEEIMSEVKREVVVDRGDKTEGLKIYYKGRMLKEIVYPQSYEAMKNLEKGKDPDIKPVVEEIQNTRNDVKVKQEPQQNGRQGLNVYYKGDLLKDNLYPNVYDIVRKQNTDKEFDLKIIEEIIEDIKKEVKVEWKQTQEDKSEIPIVYYQGKVITENEQPKIYDEVRKLGKGKPLDMKFVEDAMEQTRKDLVVKWEVQQDKSKAPIVYYKGSVLPEKEYPKIYERVRELGEGKSPGIKFVEDIVKATKIEFRIVPISGKEAEQKEADKKKEQDLEKEFKVIFNYDEQIRNDSQGDMNIIGVFMKQSIKQLFFFAFDVIAFFTIIYPSIVLLAIFNLLIQLFCRCRYYDFTSQVFYWLFVLIGSSSTLYFQVMSIYYLQQDEIQKFWFLDALIYFFSTILVFSYIKNVHQQLVTICDAFTRDNFLSTKVISTLFSLPEDSDAFVFDCTSKYNNIQIHEEYIEIMDGYQIQEITQKFNIFKVQRDDPTTFQYKGLEIVLGSNFILEIKFLQYLFLLAIIALKTGISITYMAMHDVEFDSHFTISVIATVLFYINMTWCLNKILSNYDLRRKVMMMNKINQIIDFKKILDNQEQGIIDITCPVSLETWDNTRRFVYDYSASKLQKLELVYICFFFNYIFVTVICVIAYGEFYQIIPKESLYLQPLMVIQNSFDFIFLNIILLWRIYEGQKLNDTFDESEQKIDYLIGMTEDLIHLFDIFFLPQRKFIQDQQYYPTTLHKFDITELQSQNSAELKKNNPNNQNKETTQVMEKIESNSVYGKTIMRIKDLSKFYISERVYYQGILYDEQNKRQLQMEILKNMLHNYLKIKNQIQLDSKNNCYRFLNVFKVSFNETISTVIFAFISVLPNVIPKLIEIFQKSEEIKS